MKEPTTKRGEIIEEVAGIKIIDPYRWLEDAESTEVKRWIDLQNEYTFSVLKNDEFATFSKELAENFNVLNFTNPFPVGGKYFYGERKPGEDQYAVYMKKGLDGKAIKLIDPNGLVEGNTVTIDYRSTSRTGNYVAYGLSEGGDEMPTIHIKNVDTLESLPEEIPRSKNAQISWLPDDSGFFYKRNPRMGTVPKNEEHLHSKIYFHKLGDNPENDILIFGEGRPKDDMLNITVSLDGRYLGIECSNTWTENDVYVYDRETKITTPIVLGILAKFSINFLQDKVLLETNYKANNYRLLTTSFESLYTPIDEWKEFIQERSSPIQSVSISKDKILVEYLVDACSEVIIFDYSGKEVNKIPLPKYSSVAGISANREEAEFFYGVTSFTFPQIVYRFDPSTETYSVYRKTDNPIDPEEYETDQKWFSSKDGVSVPMFIFHKKNISLNGSNPTILNGYGGFGHSQNPGFMRQWVPWLNRGGIFAIANIRGGGEFGEKWHKAGIMENKQTSFDDFIAAAEYLISQKYTNQMHLGILGASNGGLLVSAVAVQRPDLFKAVRAAVPLTDMVRFPKFGMAMRWVHEYGNPEVRKDLESILKWSPYHNVKEGMEYPHTLFTTAEKDSRVDTLHARKMAAILQFANRKNNVMLFTEMDAGHGAGKPITKMVESQALVLSFFARHLGLKI